jgi:hypothetical protein
MTEPVDVSLRPATPDDHEFMAALYASTRMEELRDTGWPESQKAAFLRMQFEAQAKHYEEHYAGAERNIVVLNGEPVGRFWIFRMPSSGSSTSPCFPRRGVAESGRRCSTG